MSVLVLDLAGLLSGRGEVAAQQLWQGVLARTAAAAAGAATPGRVLGLDVHDRADTAVLWDSETLGSPRPALLGEGLAVLLRRVADTEPHTWADVRSGRYVAGSVGSYVLARVTRGVEHVVPASVARASGLLDAVTGRWSRAGTLADLPEDALPEVVEDGALVGRTDPGCLLGLTVPVHLSGDAPRHGS